MPFGSRKSSSLTCSLPIPPSLTFLTFLLLLLLCCNWNETKINNKQTNKRRREDDDDDEVKREEEARRRRRRRRSEKKEEQGAKSEEKREKESFGANRYIVCGFILTAAKHMIVPRQEPKKKTLPPQVHSVIIFFLT